MPTPSSEVKSQVEVSSEVERAKAVFVKKLTSELKGYLGNDKGSEALAAFISNTVADRMNEKAGLEPEATVELFEGMPELHDVYTSVGREDKDAQVFSNKKIGLDAEHLQTAFEEIVRAQVLARAADIDFRGNGSKDKAGTSQKLHLDDWLVTYSSLLNGAKNNTNDFEGGRAGITTTFQKKPAKEQMADAFEKDPELFADLMVAFGVREGATEKDASFNSAWQKMPGKGFDGYGVAFQLSEEGVPYRKGKRKEDAKLILERVALFGGKAKVETYLDLASEVKEARKASATLEKEHEKLKGSHKDAQSKGEKLQSELETATQKERMLKKELTEEKAARKLAEAKAIALEQRIQEMLAIASEKVGMLSKDTRASRMRELVESSVASKK